LRRPKRESQNIETISPKPSGPGQIAKSTAEKPKPGR
jgi:hypothetical protein